MIGQMVNQAQQANPVANQPTGGMIESAMSTGVQAVATPQVSAQQQYGITPPPPSSLVSPFSPQAQQVGNGVMGGVDQRQASLGNNTPLFKKSCGY